MREGGREACTHIPGHSADEEAVDDGEPARGGAHDEPERVAGRPVLHARRPKLSVGKRAVSNAPASASVK